MHQINTIGLDNFMYVRPKWFCKFCEYDSVCTKMYSTYKAKGDMYMRNRVADKNFF